MRVAIWYSFTLVYVALAACAALGLTPPKTAGQIVTQTFGNAVAVETIIPSLVAMPNPILKSSQAEGIRQVAHGVAMTIEGYWTAYNVATACKTAAGAVVAPSAARPKPAPPPAPVVASCAGPNPTQILAATAQASAQLEAFLVTYETKGGKP